MYLRADNAKNGWGDVRLDHPHRFVRNTMADAVALVRRHLGTDCVDAVAVFGHRGPVRPVLLAAARARRIPVITRSDSNIASISGESAAKRQLRRAMMRALYPATTRVWTIGDANEEYWRRYVGRRNTVRIPYAVPRLPASTGIPPTPRESDPAQLRVLFVGRLHHAKEPLLLIRAFAALEGPEYDGWRLDLVGDGPLRAQVEEAAGTDPRITVHGACEYDRLDEYYLRSDVLVLPSAYEPWGLVVNEALGFGLRVVVSDAVGARELVTDDRIGAVFRTGSQEELVTCLREAVGHPERLPSGAVTTTADLMRRDLDRIIAEGAGR